MYCVQVSILDKMFYFALCKPSAMANIIFFLAQASTEEAFGVKADDVKDFRKPKVITREETAEVKSENSFSTEVQV